MLSKPDPGLAGRMPDIRNAVNPAERRKRLRIKRLGANGQAIDPCLAITTGVPALHGSGICLHRYLDAVRQRQNVRCLVQQAADFTGREQTRCPATEEYADDLPARHTGRFPA